ncbi:MAG: hypothetical protein CVU56_16100 [Deltaproteobacteria bacterium HGW-Deltaproteobacteria-14]|nr:MAG: hypothetical protein CVU56_16100 [Deltaproteobacteria bacterium HGW-Deltaproteobacteria-14]
MIVTSEAEQEIVDAMKTLNFTLSDARAYISLLKEHPATGYELAARSGVPRSAVYTVLRRLVGLGLINEIQQNPARFMPLPPDRLFELLESRFSRNLDSLKTAMSKLERPTADATTWTLIGYGGLLEQAETLIRNARRSIHASVWRREVLALRPVLERAVARGVDVVLFSFNTPPENVGEVLSYDIDEAELEAHWQHKLILICDHEKLLVGEAEPTEHNRSVVTDEPTLVEMAVSNLVLDVTLFGARKHRDVTSVVSRLTELLAPVDDLLLNRPERSAAR